MLFAGNVSPSFVYAATDKAQAKAELSKINSEIKAAEQKHRELREKAQAARQEILDVRRKMVRAAGSIQEQEENLESYYVDLIGGVSHE